MPKRKHSQETFPNQAKKTKKTKYYAVAKGRSPAVYSSWTDCQKQVKGFKGAVFKSFASQEEANCFIQSHSAAASDSQVVPASNYATAPASRYSIPVVPQAPPTESLTPAVSLSTVMIQAGSSITISATAPTTITIQVMGQPNGSVTSSMANVALSPPPLVPPVTLPRLMDGAPDSVVPRALAPLPNAASIAAPESRHPSAAERSKTVQIWFDGGARGNPGVQAGSGAVLVIQPDNTTWHVRQFLNGTRSRSDFRSYTNNQAEYSGIIAALEVLLEYLRQQPVGTLLAALEIRGDSQLILNQLDGTYRCQSPRLQSYLERTFGLLRQTMQTFMTLRKTMPANGLHPDIRLVHVPRSYNKSADKLANEAMDEQQSWMTRSEDGHQHRYPLPAS